MQTEISRTEVIMAGIGGRGVLVTGQTLAMAAMLRYKHVSWLPSYAIAKRGGECECTVIFSDNKIASPILPKAQALLILDSSQFKPSEKRLRPGGIVVAESAGLTETFDRNDATIIKVPALEIALGMGDSLISNFVLLGVYIATTKSLPSEIIEQELERRFAAKEDVLARNKLAFRHGLKIAAE